MSKCRCKSSLSRLVLPTGRSFFPRLVSKAVKETFLLTVEDNLPGILENRHCREFMFKVLLDISRPSIRQSCLCRIASKLYLSIQDRKCCESQVYVGKDVILEIHIKLYFDCATWISHFHLCSLHLVRFKRVTFRSKSVF